MNYSRTDSFSRIIHQLAFSVMLFWVLLVPVVAEEQRAGATRHTSEQTRAWRLLSRLLALMRDGLGTSLALYAPWFLYLLPLNWAKMWCGEVMVTNPNIIFFKRGNALLACPSPLLPRRTLHILAGADTWNRKLPVSYCQHLDSHTHIIARNRFFCFVLFFCLQLKQSCPHYYWPRHSCFKTISGEISREFFFFFFLMLPKVCSS